MNRLVTIGGDIQLSGDCQDISRNESGLTIGVQDAYNKERWQGKCCHGLCVFSGQRPVRRRGPEKINYQKKSARIHPANSIGFITHMNSSPIAQYPIAPPRVKMTISKLFRQRRDPVRRIPTTS